MAARLPVVVGAAAYAADMGASQEADGGPAEFREAVAALRSTRLRPAIALGEIPAPRRLASYAAAFAAEVAEGERELASGRLVLLHEPAGHETWQGAFRLVTLARAELEPEMAADPLLPEVGWAWLIDALDAQDVRYVEPSGTVTRCASQSFGGLADRPPVTEIEVRASWTPADGEWARHLRAWAELLSAAAGLPPDPPGVVAMPNRRAPRHP